MDRKVVSVDCTGMGIGAVLIAFLVFWAVEGWERVDCGLGITRACWAIDAEYEKRAQEKAEREAEEAQHDQ